MADLPPSTEQTLTGAEAWAAVRPEVEALEDAPTRLPSIKVQTAASQALKFHRSRLTPARAALLARFNPEAEQAEVTAAIDRLPLLAHASDHTASMMLRAAPTTRFAQLLKRAQRDRALGLFWVDGLERFGHLPPGTLSGIRAGRGHADLAGDLQAIAHHLEARWPIVEAMQTHLTDPTHAIDADALVRMKLSGARILDQLAPDADESTDWRRATLGCMHLLEQSFNRAQAALAYHLQAQGLDAEAEALPRFLGLARTNLG